MKEMLSERKQKILRAVVDEYVKLEEPVSSKELQEKYFSSLSSATIRSELNSLVELGYLVQPHVSAGRVPTELAYRFYCKKYAHPTALAREDIATIENHFQKRFFEVGEVVKRTAKLISDITNYTSVIMLSDINEVKLKEIKLVGISEESALVIVITDNGIIKDKFIELPLGITEDYLSSAVKMLNNIFAGKTLRDAKQQTSLVDMELTRFRDLYESVLEILEQCCSEEENIYLEGEKNFVNSLPDEDVKNMLSVLNNEESAVKLINDCEDMEFTIKIGKNEEGEGIDECAIVTAIYKVNGKEIGHAGVIGPQTMDYNRVMSVLQYVSKALSVQGNIKGANKNDEEK